MALRLGVLAAMAVGATLWALSSDPRGVDRVRNRGIASTPSRGTVPAQRIEPTQPLSDSTDQVVTDESADPDIEAAAFALHPPWTSAKTLRKAMDRLRHMPRYRTDVLRTGLLALQDPRMDSIARFLAETVLMLLRQDDTWTSSDLAQVDPTRTEFHELVSCCGIARLGAGAATSDLDARWLLLSQASNVYVRVEAFTNCDGLRGRPRVETGLVEALKLGPPWARRHALAGLCSWTGDAERRLGLLRPMLTDSDLHLRISAAEAMMRLGAPGEGPLSALLAIARDTESYSPGTRASAFYALAHAPESANKVLLPLLCLAMDQERAVVRGAGEAIGGLRIANRELLDAMQKRLFAPARPEGPPGSRYAYRGHSEMRESIVSALAAAAPRDESTANALQRCLGEDNAGVFIAAYHALVKTGRKPRLDPAHVWEVYRYADCLDAARMRWGLPAELLRVGAD